MSDDISQIILDELRAHRIESADRHERIENRVRSLESTRSEQRGIIRMAMIISTAISGAISLIFTNLK